MSRFLIGPQYGYRQGKWQIDGKLLIGKTPVNDAGLKWKKENKELTYHYNVVSSAGFSIAADVAYALTNGISIGANIRYLRTVPTLIGGTLTQRTINRRDRKPDLIRKAFITGSEYWDHFAYLSGNISVRFQFYSKDCKN